MADTIDAEAGTSATYVEAVLAAIDTGSALPLSEVLRHVTRPDKMPTIARLFDPEASRRFVELNARTTPWGGSRSSIAGAPERLREQDIPVWPNADPHALNLHFEWHEPPGAGAERDAVLEIRARIARFDALGIPLGNIVVEDVVAGSSTWRLSGKTISEAAIASVMAGVLLLAFQTVAEAPSISELGRCVRLHEHGYLRSITCYNDQGLVHRVEFPVVINAETQRIRAVQLGTGVYGATLVLAGVEGGTERWLADLGDRKLTPLQDRRLRYEPFEQGPKYEIEGKLRESDGATGKPPLLIVTKAERVLR